MTTESPTGETTHICTCGVCGKTQREMVSQVLGIGEVPEFPFIGDHVVKTGGDYVYDGEVRGIVVKKSGKIRYDVEDNRGLLFIFNGEQLKSSEPTKRGPLAFDKSKPITWCLKPVDQCDGTTRPCIREPGHSGDCGIVEL